MEHQKIGKYSIKFKESPHIIGAASVVGKKEAEGPLGDYFDHVELDDLVGMSTWEDAESELQKLVLEQLQKNTNIKRSEIDFLFSGDLESQVIATTFGLLESRIPLFGLYSACATMGEAMILASMGIAGGFGRNIAALVSSHFASAEKTFRYPLSYGNQRPFSSTWTVTGAGAVLLSNRGGKARISGVTVGMIVDSALKDSRNMGACMAPAAIETIYHHFVDFNRKPSEYDRVITGDLGVVGKRILEDGLLEKGYNISKNHLDCGLLIYDHESQDTHSGGSGCACSAVVFASYILPKIEKGEWKKVLFIPTGALLSQVSFNEGKSVPAIAHAIVIEHC